MRPANEPSKPRLTIRRRLNDFSGRSPSVLVANGSCCCCCCCLHWVGAAAGAIVGSVSASLAEGKAQPPVHPEAKSYVVGGAWIGFAAAVLIIILSIAVVSSVHQIPGMLVDALLFSVAFVPSLAMLPVGAGALLGATCARSLASSAAVRDGGTEYETSFGLRMAWRMAWQVFLFSTLFAGVGYGLMVLIGLLSR